MSPIQNGLLIGIGFVVLDCTELAVHISELVNFYWIGSIQCLGLSLDWYRIGIGIEQD